MEMNINNTHIIDEVEEVTKRIGQLMGKEIDITESIDFINTEVNTIFYFDKELKRKSYGDMDVRYAWVDSGYKYKGAPVFISLINYLGKFYGHYVGTGSFLVNRMCSKDSRNERIYRKNYKVFTNGFDNDVKQRTTKYIYETSGCDKQAQEYNEAQAIEENKKESLVKEIEGKIELEKSFFESKELTNVTQEIFDHLLFPSWKSIYGLDRYIKIMGKRIEQLVKDNKTEYYVRNNMGSVIINSGLMNQFGKDYLICYRVHMKYKHMVAYKIMESKMDYLENGFSKEQASVELKPIKFGEMYDFLFCPTMNDFDIKHKTLEHIIEQRIERFPENLRFEESSKIASLLISALERGVRMQMRDKSYTKVSYSGKTGELSWLMPFHINAKLTEEPELVIVIVRRGDFYDVKTVLPYNDELKDRITALSLYTNLW